jgi:hypothetical protein
MTEISTIVSTTEFWFSAVLVGLVINVVSSYIPGILGKIFGKAVTSWNKRNEKSKKRWQQQVDLYSSSYQQLYLGCLERNAKQTEIIHQLAMAAVFMLIGIGSGNGSIGILIGLFPLFSSLTATIKHGRFRLVITEAEINLKHNKPL